MQLIIKTEIKVFINIISGTEMVA